MKIAFDFVATFKPSGSKTYVLNFLNNFFNQNTNNTYYIFITKNYCQFFNNRNPNIKIIKIPNIFSHILLKFLWIQFLLPLILIFLKFDKLFSPLNYTPLILKLSKIKKILIVHSNLPFKKPCYLPGNFFKNQITNLLMKYSIYTCDHLISISDFARKELEGLLSFTNSKHHRIYLGCNHFQNKNEKYLKDFNYNDKYILSVISCTKYHDIIFLINGYKKFLDKTGENIKLIFVMQVLDNNYFNKINNLITFLKLEKKIKIITSVQNDYLPQIYKNAHLYLFLSYSEVFGLTSLEAMNFRIPVLISNSSALTEVNGDAPIYFEIDNQLDFVKKLKIAVSDDNLRKKMITKGVENLNRFDWNNTVNETINIIENA
tara:strand:+ start:88 stop:1209 length:1122 start_codon:yes stop_codon:yes gene_type:complete